MLSVHVVFYFCLVMWKLCTLYSFALYMSINIQIQRIQIQQSNETKQENFQSNNLYQVIWLTLYLQWCMILFILFCMLILPKCCTFDVLLCFCIKRNTKSCCTLLQFEMKKMHHMNWQNIIYVLNLCNWKWLFERK